MADDAHISKKILEAVPATMWSLRAEMRRHAPKKLSLPQFRVLAHISRGIHLASELAELQGTSLPSMSNLIDGLVEKGYVRRKSGTRDRRQVILEHTARGKAQYLKVRQLTEMAISTRVKNLSPKEKDELIHGLSLLEKVFR